MFLTSIDYVPNSKMNANSSIGFIHVFPSWLTSFHSPNSKQEFPFLPILASSCFDNSVLLGEKYYFIVIHLHFPDD